VDEDVLATAVESNEAEPLLRIVPCDRTDTFFDLPVAKLPARGSARLEEPGGRAPNLIEPFDDCVNRLPPLLRAWLRPVQPPSGKAIRGGVIVVVTAALGLAVIVVAAHLIVHEQS
jgi:hypothetical protein